MDFESNLVDPNASIKDSLIKMNLLKYKILLVINENKTLIGTITEGDIRRGLISGLQLENRIETIYNSNPIVKNDIELIESKERIMNRFAIDFLPEVDKDGKIKYLFIRQSKKLSEIDTPVLIMAGGMGKRLLPLTTHTPKPMLKIGDHSLLEIHIKRLTEYGFKNIFISVNYLKNEIIENLKDGSRFGASIQYIEEKWPLGTIGSISMLKNTVNKPVLVINSDVLTEVDFLGMLNEHEKSSNMLTIGTYEYQYQIPYGVISISNNEVVGICEKPKKIIDIYAGISVISPEVMMLIRTNSKMDMPELIYLALNTKLKFGNFFIGNYWRDIGTPSNLDSAREEVYSELNKDE